MHNSTLNLRTFSLLAAAVFMLSSCGKSKKQLAPKPEELQTQNTKEKKPSKVAPLLVMSYNVENLFDDKHDPGKNDYEYITDKETCRKGHEKEKGKKCSKIKDPKKKQNCIAKYDRRIGYCHGWTDAKLEYKIQQIKKVFDLRKIKNGEENTPDIVGLSEVENEHVLGRLARALKYPEHILVEGLDTRGIDVALMYRPSKNLKYIGHISHPVGEVYRLSRRHTRPILEVQFEYLGKPLFVYVNHWPSQGGKSLLRSAAASKLNKVITHRLSQKGAAFIALGDFNTLFNEKEAAKHPIRDVLLQGKKPLLKDVIIEAKNAGKALPRGSSHYGGDWEFLDRIFVSPNLVSKDLEVFAPPELLTECKFNEFSCPRPQIVPHRYKHSREAGDPNQGYSDHLPIYLKVSR